jgi:hypothetical protein
MLRHLFNLRRQEVKDTIRVAYLVRLVCTGFGSTGVFEPILDRNTIVDIERDPALTAPQTL